RTGHTAVWTGTRMIVWGGRFALDTGGLYDPIGDSWSATTTTGAPAGRMLHTAVWTGTDMLVWGGQDTNLQELNTGGRYRPGTNTWLPMSTVSAPGARYSASAVWTGAEMLIWGGTTNTGLRYPAVGGRYSPSTDSWQSISTVRAPAGRFRHT